MALPQIVIVDDELAIRQVLSSSLRKEGYQVEDFGDAETAFDRISRGDIDVAISDIRMPGMSGIDLMKKVQESSIETTFLLMTAYASVDTAIEAMKVGAFDYMTKPVHAEEVLHQLRQISDLRVLRNENRLLRSIVLGDKEKRCSLNSPTVQNIDNMIAKVAVTDSTVLVAGESGTGKGVIARDIHKKSHRANAAFIPVNCGSIPDNLMESEFFGHTKGAFTGADKPKKGLFIEADKGTIFLDEIGELPLHLQVKLLHVLEDKEVRPLGSEQFKRVDVRIVAATNRDLGAMVDKGEFREDLYFRLNVFSIDVPPLRDRKSDILRLVYYFLQRDSSRFAKEKPLTLGPEVESMLVGYDWPGNIREVENVISRALILADGEQISVADLPKHITHNGASIDVGADISPGMNLRDQLRIVEHGILLRTIEEVNGDRQVAAKKLGIGQSTLYRKLEEFEQFMASL